MGRFSWLIATATLFFLYFVEPVASYSAISQREPNFPEAAIDKQVYLTIGELNQDGPSTPEHIALYLPVEGMIDAPVHAEVHYRKNGVCGESHPLFFIRPEFSGSESKLRPAFAGVITGLEPGGRYLVEVMVRSGNEVVRRSIVASTSRLPPSSPAPTKKVRAGTSAAVIQRTFEELEAGDVLLFEDGEYEVDNLTLKASGTPDKPIYIKGETRNGVTLRDTS